MRAWYQICILRTRRWDRKHGQVAMILGDPQFQASTHVELCRPRFPSIGIRDSLVSVSLPLRSEGKQITTRQSGNIKACHYFGMHVTRSYEVSEDLT